MPEVASAVLLPDLGAPTKREVLTQALLWERLEIPLYADRIPRDEELVAQKELELLEQEGVVRYAERSLPPTPRLEPRFIPLVEGLLRSLKADEAPPTPPGQEPAPRLVAMVDELMGSFREETRQLAVQSADRQSDRLNDSLAFAGDLGLAPVADGFFNQFGALLPAPSVEAPVHEASLICASVKSVSVAEETDPEEILRFRETHRDSVGRFRGAMCDLASGMREGKSPTARLEQADAIVANRVEPALGDLEAALKASRISYVWQSIFGASSVVASTEPVTSVLTASAHFATRSLKYAFDRERLVREHPYGFVHSLRQSYGSDEGAAMAWRRRPVTDPREELRRLFVGALGAYNDLREEQIRALLLGQEALPSLPRANGS